MTVVSHRARRGVRVERKGLGCRAVGKMRRVAFDSKRVSETPQNGSVDSRDQFILDDGETD